MPAGEGQVVGTETLPDTAFQEGTITIPVQEEQAVVQKDAVVTGEVQISKRVETETQTVEGDVRRTEVEVDSSDLSDDMQVQNALEQGPDSEA